jgi:hypothetical protein
LGLDSWLKIQSINKTVTEDDPQGTGNSIDTGHFEHLQGARRPQAAKRFHGVPSSYYAKQELNRKYSKLPAFIENFSMLIIGGQDHERIRTTQF